MGMVGDPGWAVAPDGGHLVVTAGADAVYLLEDVAESTAAVVARFWSANPPADDDVPDEARPVVAHLIGLGALRPKALDGHPRRRVRILTVGGPVPFDLPGIDLDPTADFAVVLRTNATLRDLAKTAEDLATTGTPHVLVDLAFEHTIVLGPFVVPGDTACLSCLAGRVGTRWGDPQPPAEPRATHPTNRALAAHLAAAWLQLDPAHAAGLANATVALNLQDFTTRREPLWPTPACPVCREWRTSGRVALPWTAERAAR